MIQAGGLGFMRLLLDELDMGLVEHHWNRTSGMNTVSYFPLLGTAPMEEVCVHDGIVLLLATIMRSETGSSCLNFRNRRGFFELDKVPTSKHNQVFGLARSVTYSCVQVTLPPGQAFTV